jgi:nucleoside-diphosphate-sugar epimerase
MLRKNLDTRVFDAMLYGNNGQLPQNVEVVKGDITDVDSMSRSLVGIDTVVHLAGIVGDTACDLDKDRAVRVNYLATRNLAHLTKEKGVKLVFSSTCSVYGAMPNTSLTEESKVAPFSIYAIAKLAAEEAILNTNSNSIMLRMGTLHGLSQRMRFDLVMNRFVAQAIQDRKITVFGGEQYRPLLHIDDAVQAYIRATKSNVTGVFNIGGENRRIIDVAEEIKQSTGCQVDVLKDVRDPRNYIVSSNKAKQVLGISFRKRTADTINEITNAYREGDIKDYRNPIYSNELMLKK